MPNKHKKGRGRNKKPSQEQPAVQGAQTENEDHPLLDQATGSSSHEGSHQIRQQSETVRSPDQEERRSRKGSEEQPAVQGIQTQANSLLNQSAECGSHELSHQIRQQSETVRPPDQEGISPLKSAEDSNRKPEVQERALSTKLTSKTKETAPALLPESPDKSEPMLTLESHMPIGKKTRKMAERQPAGTLGYPIDLIANYFALQYNDINIFHYDIDIIFKAQYRTKEKADASGNPEPIFLKKGESIMNQGRTAKEDKKKNVPNVEHQQKKLPGKQRCRKIISELIKDKSLRAYNPSYDGQKNLYTTKALPIIDSITPVSKFEIKLTEEVKGQTLVFEVIIKPVEKSGSGNQISLEPLRDIYSGRSKEIPYELIMAFDTVMCHQDPPFTQMQVGRSFFLLGEQKYQLGEGLEIWFGYNQSVHLTQRGPAVIVNYAAKAFHREGNVVDCACEILGRDIRRKLPRLSSDEIDTLRKAWTKIRVEVLHQKNLSYRRKYHVQGLTDTSASDKYFNLTGTKTSVADYFEKNYEKLLYPHLPCLFMRGCKKEVFMPMEVCYIIPNQPKLGELSAAVTTKMIKKMAISPPQRFDKIMENAQRIQEISGPLMREFGLLMELKFMQLQGRVLPAPQLGYKSSSGRPFSAKVDRSGSWRMDNMEFFRSTDSTMTWMIISFSDEKDCSLHDLQSFAETFCSSARRSGINIKKPADIRIFRKNEKTKSALEYAKQLKVTLAVVVLSEEDRKKKRKIHTYEEVKFIADTELQLKTQCIKDKVIKRYNSQVSTNVLLKINPKTGGINHRLLQRPEIFSRPFIVFGADATHSPRGHPCPSIAAVVGSLDAFLGQYASTCRVQQNPNEGRISQEIIIELKDMVKEILRAFKKNTLGKKPERIIFIRDGVSEGQFNTVLEKEVNLVQYACIEELDGFLPTLTFIVVQKRHQTRFRPQNFEEGVGPGNVPPGTTVDTDVVHPVFFDFFLCSHESKQGTSRPAHYTVLYDENSLSSNELQQLCYFLCHTYHRCNRSISVPAPVRYAHLACKRAKSYADKYLDNLPRSTSSSSSKETPKLSDAVINAINNMGSLQSGGMWMFYT